MAWDGRCRWSRSSVGYRKHNRRIKGPGRDGGYPPPLPQIRTGPIKASERTNRTAHKQERTNRTAHKQDAARLSVYPALRSFGGAFRTVGRFGSFAGVSSCVLFSSSSSSVTR